MAMLVWFFLLHTIIHTLFRPYIVFEVIRSLTRSLFICQVPMVVSLKCAGVCKSFFSKMRNSLEVIYGVSFADNLWVDVQEN